MKPRPNDRCACGSGARYKKCCGAPGVRPSPFTPDDRRNALLKLEPFAAELVGQEARKELAREFFGESLFDEDEDPYVLETSFFAFQCWSFFDTRDDDGTCVAEVALEETGLLAHGERAFVKAALGVRMRLYEVASVAAGETLTLRDVLDESVRTVRERTASRTLRQWDVIATRVFPVGSSGQPELDGGVFPIGRHHREALIEELQELVDDATDEELDEVAREEFPPLFFEVWRAPMPIPKLVNHDGHELCQTRVFYDATKPARVAALLDRAPSLSRDEGAERWRWSGPSREQGDDVLRGTIERKGKRLILETNSRERAEAGRKLLEAAVGDLIAYRLTETSDTRSAVERSIASGKKRPPAAEISPEVLASVAPQIEAMMKAHYARWLDEPVPMFDGKTPREAATGPLRPRVVEVLKDLDGAYQRARAEGQPAFDPRDLRAALGIDRDAG